MPGFKLFKDNQILTSDNFMEYLAKQAVIVCQTTSDRDLGLATDVVEGMTAYTKDNDQYSVYDGLSWVRIATYSDVTAVYNERDNRIRLTMEHR